MGTLFYYFLKDRKKIFLSCSLLFCFAITLFTLLEQNKTSFSLSSLKKDNTTTILQGKSIQLFLSDGRFRQSQTSSESLLLFPENEKKRSFILRGEVHSLSKEDDSTYETKSDEAELLWRFTKENSQMNGDTIELIRFSGNVTLSNHSEIVKTKEAFYLPKTKILLGHHFSRFYTSKNYLESKKGFKWDLENGILSIQEGAEGVSFAN